MYVVVFSCTATRAFHLEVVPVQDTLQTLLAIRRFLAAYPGCRCIISDNANSFVRAAMDLKRVFNSMKDPAVPEVLNGRSIEWSALALPGIKASTNGDWDCWISPSSKLSVDAWSTTRSSARQYASCAS